MIQIKKTKSNFEREPLLTPFGFKGQAIDELWQVAAFMEDQTGNRAIGLGTQSVLWSDAGVFAAYSQSAGNSIMYLMTEFALKAAQGNSFNAPPELLDQLLPITYAHGSEITGNRALRLTFALNALVPVDIAAWLLYAGENGIDSFDGMLPEEIRPVLSYRHEKLASVPLITYGMPLEDIKKIVEGGHSLLKIKIGSDPEKDSDREKMLKWDMQRLSDIHMLVREYQTEYTDSGRISYYLDANGRYDTRDRLLRLLDFAYKIGALDRIMLLEEPFSEENKIDVHGIPVRMAADESVHSEKDAFERADLGYRAFALKPIAKTVSMSIKILKVAHLKGIPCFCADLTVNPILVDWNKNFAVRLAALPGMKIGMLEANGCQNYRNWQQMKMYHPCRNARWIDSSNGLFRPDNDFYDASGGIFMASGHYKALLQ